MEDDLNTFLIPTNNGIICSSLIKNLPFLIHQRTNTITLIKIISKSTSPKHQTWQKRKRRSCRISLPHSIKIKITLIEITLLPCLISEIRFLTCKVFVVSRLRLFRKTIRMNGIMNNNLSHISIISKLRFRYKKVKVPMINQRVSLVSKGHFRFQE